MFLDVIEIDAASNNGVENARALIEMSRFQPTAGKYKVYIVDEVHMLSTSAFNALLKTLEEPPDHVRFILATTNIEKVLETVVSRTERYDFRSIPLADMIERLRFIAKEEGITYEDKALELIAKIAKGGLRDAIVLFEQYAHAGALTYDIVADHLLATDDSFKSDFLDAFRYKDSEKLLGLVASLRDDSKDMRLFSEEMFIHLKDGLIRSIGTPDFSSYEQCFALFESFYVKSKAFHDPYLLLEVMALRVCHAPIAHPQPTASPVRELPPHSMPIAPITRTEAVRPAAPVKKPAPAPEDFFDESNAGPMEELPPDFFDAPPTSAKDVPSRSKASSTKAPTEPAIGHPPVRVTAPASDTFSDPSETSATMVPPADFDYLRLVEHIKKIPKRGFVGMSMQASSYAFSDSTLIIRASSDFHAAKLDTPEIRGVIAEAVLHLFGTPYTVEVRKGGSPTLPPKRNLAQDAADIF